MSPTFPDLFRKERGFGAVVALFVIVVLGGMGAVLVTVFNTQQRNSAADALGIQAYQAAHSGVEVAAFLALSANSCGDVSIPFAPFTVRLQCTRTQHVEGGQTINVYQLTATACNRNACPANANDESYVERQLRATVTDTPGSA